jgi:hypothetical protein
MKTYSVFLALHVTAGAIALTSFWIAAVLRKGSEPHRRVGRAYLLAMTAVLLTALPLAVSAFMHAKPVTGIFLVYLVLITATSGWTAWRAIRDRQSIATYAGPVFQLLGWLNLVAGVAVLALGIGYGVALLVGMSFIGLTIGPLMLRFARRSQHDRRWWLAQHFGGIIGTGVATHVAFLGLGLTRVVPAEFAGMTQNFAFFGPLAISLVARLFLYRKYLPAAPGAVASVTAARG